MLFDYDESNRTTGGRDSRAAPFLRGHRMADSPALIPATLARPRRWARGLWRWTRRGLLVLAILVLLYSFALPWYVRGKIVSALRDAGLSHATVEVESISPWRAELDSLEIGNATGLSVGSIDVTYEPDVMGSGRVHTVTIDGAELRVAVKDGKLDFGPLANFKASGGPATGAFKLPFERANLRASSAVVDWDSQSFRFPLAGSIEQRTPGKAEFHLSVSIAGAPVEISGTLTENQLRERESTDKLFGVELYQIKGDIRALGHTLRVDAAYNPSNGEVMIDAEPRSISPDKDSRQSPTRLRLDGTFVGSQGKRLLTLQGKLPRWTAGASAADAVTLRDLQFTIRVENAGGSWMAGVSTQCGSVAWGNTTAHAVVLSLRNGQSRSDAAATTRPAEVSDNNAFRDWTVALSAGPIEHKSSTMTASLHQLDASGDIAWRGFAVPDFAGRIAVSGASFADTKSGLAVSGANADIPIRHGVAGSKPGGFKVPAIRWKDRTLPALAGDIQIQDGRLDANAQWPLFKEAAISLAARVNLFSLSPGGTLTAKLPEFALADESQIRKLIHGSAAEGLDIDGTLGLDASLTFNGGDLTPRATVTLKDFNLHNNEQEFAAEGITGSVTFDSLAPTTPPAQKFTIKKLKSKKLVLKDGTIAFRVESPDSLLVERTAWGFEDGQGSLHIHAFRYHPSQEKIDLEAFIENINVKQWISLITGDKAAGEGLMYGRVPVVFHTGKRKRIEFGRGFLYANPGTGWFQIKSRDWLDQAVGGAALDPGAIAAEVEARIKEGLGNFEYSYLTFEFFPEKEGLLCVLVAKGKSRNPDKPVNFQGITINFRGLEEAINANLGFEGFGK